MEDLMVWGVGAMLLVGSFLFGRIVGKIIWRR